LSGALYWFIHDSKDKPIYIYNRYIEVSFLSSVRKSPFFVNYYCSYIYDNIVKFNVKNHQKVKKGDLIGYVASKTDTQPIITEECSKVK